MRNIYNDGQVVVTADDCDTSAMNGAEVASHLYTLSWQSQGRMSCITVEVGLPFQKGPVQEAGINGVSNEALLSIVADRLSCFQNSRYSCEENHEALEHIKMAMAYLQARTANRQARGVKGTSAV